MALQLFTVYHLHFLTPVHSLCVPCGAALFAHLQSELVKKCS